jgi:SAM-dependent methyltransferase
VTQFKDHFSGHADIYREARPTYPLQLFTWLAQKASDTALAWDCGCGNGQATIALAQYFTKVVGTDPSANQIAAAQAHANIEYRVEPAEKSSLGDATVSLVTVAQALHWFEHERFYAEVKRVLKPGGMFAAWAYSDCNTSDATIDHIKNRLYVDLTGPYWPPERDYVDAGYKTLPFPFAEITVPPFVMSAQWTVDHLLAYFRSWSATQCYIKAKGEDPVAIIEADLRAAWGDPARVREVRWQFHLRMGSAGREAK